ncbi:MAG: hypothetical protein J5651_00500 [Salinivirgaceae bacterium]|nr:hypothetical protein [Salinivirgaceae bacterium]
MITKQNLKSEFENYKQFLKNDEMRQKVQEAIEISEFYGEDTDITRAVDAICEMVNRFIDKADKFKPTTAKTPAAKKTEKRKTLADYKFANKFMCERQKPVVREGWSELESTIARLDKQLAEMPKLYKQEKLGKKAIVYAHYFFGSTDIFVTEADDELMFGYTILNGDCQSSEYGNQSIEEITNSKYCELDFYWDNKTLEQALYDCHPDYFPEPKTDEPTETDEAKARRIRIAEAEAEAALALLELVNLSGVDVAERPRTTDLFGNELERDRWQKRWDARRKKYIYTDNDGEEWYKNERGHYCLLNGNDSEDIRDHAVNILRNEFPQAKYRDEIEEFVETRDEDELNEDDIIDDFIGWLGDDIVYFLWDRFPDYQDEADEFINSGHWDDNVSRYENLKAFKKWLDDEIGETVGHGKLFDIEELTDTTGRVTPLYNIDNKNDYFNREDLSFVMRELGDYLPKHSKHLERVWIDENDTYRFEFGEGAYTENAPADKKWYINAFRAIQERFPSVSDSFIEEFVADGWDNTAELYDNLKAFKEWLDDKTGNTDGGELFEVGWEDYGAQERGVLRPLYTINDQWGEDYSFAEQWLRDTLAVDNLAIDRMWINETDGTYGFLTKYAK